MLLEHVKNVGFIDEELENEFQELTESIATLLNELDSELGMRPDGSGDRMPAPGQADREMINPNQFQDSDPEAIMAAMETIVKQMEAAKKGMQILNKMGDSPFRTKNKSRVMGNLNRIRGSLQRVEKMMNEVQ
jgi:hypothetical protein